MRAPPLDPRTLCFTALLRREIPLVEYAIIVRIAHVRVLCLSASAFPKRPPKWRALSAPRAAGSRSRERYAALSIGTRRYFELKLRVPVDNRTRKYVLM